MEAVHGRDKVSKFAPKDVISNMPHNVITKILDRLSLQDAVKTGIMSRNWRYKWTMLSQLVFDDKFFKYLVETKDEKNHGKIITRLLLHLKGVVTKFVLSINEECCSVLDEKDITHWVLFLSRNGIKDLTFSKRNGKPLKLPTHLFSCLDLKHLKLVNCCFIRPVNFHGFPNLLSLELDITIIENIKLGELITRCPLLQILNMLCGQPYLRGYLFNMYLRNKLKLADISKLVNLKELSVSLWFIQDLMITSPSGIFELVGFLPKLQSLHLDFAKCNLIEGGAKKTFPTVFPCLKDLKLSSPDLGKGIVLSCVFEMIRRFSNMQTLEITEIDWIGVATPEVCSPEVDNTVELLQLRSVVFTHIKASDNVICLVKYLLNCSPFLKKILIRDLCLPYDQKLGFATELLKLHRASSAAEIVLC